jgi:hypothetical protein
MLGRERIPLREACGRYVDWYSLRPTVPETAIAGVPAPAPREPQQEP